MLTRNTPGAGLQSSQLAAVQGPKLCRPTCCRPYAFAVVATTVTVKRLVIVENKKQSLTLYLHAETSNCCILVAC